MHALYEQLVRLFTVSPDTWEPGELPLDSECGVPVAEVATVCLSLCHPILVPRVSKGGVLGERVKRLPTVVDAMELAMSSKLLVLRFLEHTGLKAHLPLPVAGVKLHQFLVLVDPSIGNADPDAFLAIVDAFDWPAECLFRMLLKVLVHPLPDVTSAPRTNWCDTKLTKALVRRLGSRVVAAAPTSAAIRGIDTFAPPLPDWALAPTTAVRFHAKRLDRDEYSFDSLLSWAAVQSADLVPLLLHVKWSDEDLFETVQWLFQSGRYADDLPELKEHREAHCVAADRMHMDNCPYSPYKLPHGMVHGQTLHHWCHCSGARLVGHIDPVWTVAHATTEEGLRLEESMRSLIRALGRNMPPEPLFMVTKLADNNHNRVNRPEMKRVKASMLLHMGRYMPTVALDALEHNADYYSETPEGRKALAEFFRQLLNWTIPACQIRKNRHRLSSVPGKDVPRYRKAREDLVGTLLDAPWSLLPPNWENPLAAAWYLAKHGKDPNLAGAATSAWNQALPEGMTAEEVDTSKTDEERLEEAKAQGRYVDLDALGPEQLCVKVKIEGTEGEYETVYNSYGEKAAVEVAKDAEPVARMRNGDCEDKPICLDDDDDEDAPPAPPAPPTAPAPPAAPPAPPVVDSAPITPAQLAKLKQKYPALYPDFERIVASAALSNAQKKACIVTIVNSEKARAVLDAAPTEPVPAPAASTDSRVGAPWTKEEDDLLRAAKGASRNRRWGEIADAVPGRTRSGVRIRWQRLEEDARNKQRAEHAATAPVPVPVPVPAEAPVAEHKLLVDLPKDYAAGDRMKVMLANDENMLGTVYYYDSQGGRAWQTHHGTVCVERGHVRKRVARGSTVEGGHRRAAPSRVCIARDFETPGAAIAASRCHRHPSHRRPSRSTARDVHVGG